MSNRIVDVTPHPAILTVLGEIELRPWQCVAELIDNSIDGFLKMQRAGTPIGHPLVRVALGQDTVVVKDNGPGMSLDALEMAVKAGWTSNDKFGNLGLYGIGFNIATARLGSLTTIWTTRAGDEEWYGLQIDLPIMAKGGSYLLQPKTRMKSDPNSSGTEIEVSGLRAEWKGYFLNSQWVRANLTDQLARTYSTMLRAKNPQPIKFSLYLNDKTVPAWEHCVWPADWAVYRKNEGNVRPVQEFDVTFGKKYFSRSTGELHDSSDGLLLEDIIEVPERVYGWIGIQRYANTKEFGIDVIRNGRKIEVGTKSLFEWEDVTEYPIDDPRGKGRIVGEVHLDHGYVFYTKHRFEREHSSWKQLLQVVRNNEPLINRKRSGFIETNESPLGLLFRVFRRNSPLTQSKQTWADILFIQDNAKAKDWADKYRKATPEFLDNEKWRKELIVDSPEQLTVVDQNSIGEDTGTNSGDDETDIGLGTGPVPAPVPFPGATNEPKVTPSSTTIIQEPTVQKTLIPELSFTITGIGVASKSYMIEVYGDSSSSLLQTAVPWRSRVTERGVFEIDVRLQHPVFNSTSLQIRDAVLADVAHYIASEEAAVMGVRGGVSYADILVALRSRYATNDSLDLNQLRTEIDEMRKSITRCLFKDSLEAVQREILTELPMEEVRRIELAHSRGSSTAKITDYLEMWHLAHLLEQQPARFFETGCFNRSWIPSSLAQNTSLLTEYQQQLAQDVWMPMVKLGEFTNPLTPPPDSTRSYFALIRACIGRVHTYMTSME